MQSAQKKYKNRTAVLKDFLESQGVLGTTAYLDGMGETQPRGKKATQVAKCPVIYYCVLLAGCEKDGKSVAELKLCLEGPTYIYWHLQLKNLRQRGWERLMVIANNLGLDG